MDPSTRKTRFGGKVLVHFWKQLGTCDGKYLKEKDFVSAHKSQGDFGKRHQELLKALYHPLYRRAEQSFKRDGNSCLLTGKIFVPFKKWGIHPAPAHIVPNAVYGKPETLKCIAMFASAAAREDIVSHLNNIGNAMNMQQDVHISYDKLDWGTEAKEEDGEVKYFFRMVPTDPDIGDLGDITLREGDEIRSVALPGHEYWARALAFCSLAPSAWTPSNDQLHTCFRLSGWDD